MYYQNNIIDYDLQPVKYPKTKKPNLSEGLRGLSSIIHRPDNLSHERAPQFFVLWYYPGNILHGFLPFWVEMMSMIDILRSWV